MGFPKRLRNTKIVATLGPASSNPDIIRQLFEAGVDVFRLNMSHGTHEEHAAIVRAVRDIQHQTGRPIGILLDLQGPKLRIGTFEKGAAVLEDGAEFTLTLADVAGTATRASLPHPEIFKTLKPGADILLNDGLLRLKAISVGPTEVLTRVMEGGVLSDHKGVNLPGVTLPISTLTEKDRVDLEFGLSMDVDWIALSFVQSPEDLIEVREIIDGRAGLLAKLERPSAIDQLEAVVAQSDAVMVARGDLGVEFPPEQVPALQKRIISVCRAMGKPVIVATQMLESMTASHRPTRAEASDVATAIYDGADAVMLSAETASGRYPLGAVSVMDRIIGSTEADETFQRIMDTVLPETGRTDSDAISTAACHVARSRGCGAVVTFTSTGATTLRVSRMRCPVPILGLTPSERISRRLCLVWGVHSVLTKDIRSFTEMVKKSTNLALREKMVGVGDRIVITAGVPFGTPGATNVLHIAEIHDPSGKS